MPTTKGELAARKVLDESGFDEITGIPIELFAAGLGATLVTEDLKSYDGKITCGKNKAIIKVDSKIEFPTTRRFVIAHELGHLVMHRSLSLPVDSSGNFNLIEGMELALKSGGQEVEANEFANELLMPKKLFLEEAWGRRFSPALARRLAERFRTTITAAVLRYFRFDLHPLCLFFIENGVVKYWRKSDGLKVWIQNGNGQKPPSDSVAAEYIQKGYGYIYSGAEKEQEIKRSTWFDVTKFPQDDNTFYEYCIPNKTSKTILSVVWED